MTMLQSGFVFLLVSGLGLSGILSKASSAKEADRGVRVAVWVDEFYETKVNDPGQCDPPNHGECIRESCDHLSSFDCKDRKKIELIARSCRGNYGGGCVHDACGLLGRFGCDDLGEVTQVAQACSGNLGGACILYVCDKLGRFECDDLSEVLDVARQCSGH